MDYRKLRIAIIDKIKFFHPHQQRLVDAIESSYAEDPEVIEVRYVRKLQQLGYDVGY